MRPETKDSIVLTVGTGVTALLSLAYSSASGRLLEEEVFGELNAALALAFFCTIALGPINGTVARFTAQYAARGEFGKIISLSREIMRRLVRYGMAALVVGVVLLWPLAKAMKFQSPAALGVAYGMVFLTLLLSVYRGVLRGVQRYDLLNVNSVSESILRLAIGVPLILVVPTAWMAVAAYVVAVAAVMGLSRRQLTQVWGDHAPQFVDGAAVKRFTLPIFLMMLATAGFMNFDMLFVKYRFSEAAGDYGASFTLARTVSAIFTPFQILILPLLTTMYERKGPFGATLARICGYFLLLAAGPILLFAIWPDEVLRIVYGAKYSYAADFLLSVTVVRVLNALAMMMALAFLSKDSFGFLFAYLAALVAQGVVMFAFGDSPARMINAVLVTQAVLVLVLLVLLMPARRSDQSTDFSERK